MKFCTKCGRQLPDEAMFCDKCGSAVSGLESTSATDPFGGDPFNANHQNVNAAQNNSQNGEVSTLKLVAKIFMILACVASAFAIIPLAWTIPMTVSYSNKIKNHEPVSVGFKICTLLFVNVVSGILMLCDTED